MVEISPGVFFFFLFFLKSANHSEESLVRRKSKKTGRENKRNRKSVCEDKVELDSDLIEEHRLISVWNCTVVFCWRRQVFIFFFFCFFISFCWFLSCIRSECSVQFIFQILKNQFDGFENSSLICICFFLLLFAKRLKRNVFFWHKISISKPAECG